MAAGAAICISLLFGVSFEAVTGIVTLLTLLAWVLIEFVNLRMFLARIFHRAAPREDDSVDNVLGTMYRTTPYAATRNARQERGHNGRRDRT
jgi:hypothetical protein